MRGPPRSTPSSASASPFNSQGLSRHVASNDSVSQEYYKNASAPRIYTDVVVIEAIRAEYPELHLITASVYSCDISGWAAAGHAELTPIDKEKDQLKTRYYIPPLTRIHGEPGALVDDVQFAKYLIKWQDKEFIMYYVSGRDGTSNYSEYIHQHILSPSIDSINSLLQTAGVWSSLLHDEIWVFEQGYWDKSPELFESIRHASWDDVILKQAQKDAIRDDCNSFFDGRETFERLRVPWKRGVIFHGPPGNGKTVSVKATINMLWKRKESIPALYVKTLANFYGPEFAIGEIFQLARTVAPCYLIFEDLDSVVTDEVRSFFLNAVDGIQKNDGIFMVGSTNHLERLDPGISKRPSRFDRKFRFDNPDTEERTAYMKYWQKKLSDQEDVEMPDKICPAVAKITKGFSFAYLQEAMVASLLVIARDGADGFSEIDAEGSIQKTCLECMEVHSKPENGRTCDRSETCRPFKGLYDFVWNVRQTDDEDPDLDNYILWREVKKQVRILREELDNETANRR